MPVKDCSSADLDRTITSIERRGGRIVQVVAAGDGAYKVVFEERADRKETRVLVGETGPEMIVPPKETRS